MKYVGLGIHIKPDLYLKDYRLVFELHNLALNAKSRREHISYCKRIIETLTTCKKARFYHVLLINKVLKLAEMVSDKVRKADEEKKALKLLDDAVMYISPKVNMTPDDFMSKIKAYQLQPYIDNVIRIRLDDWRAQILAAHNPVKFYEEIQSNYKKLENRVNKIEKDTKEIKRCTNVRRLFALASR